MLATMLERSLCLTFRSPNPRISQGWEGKEPASAGFLLAVVLVCYAQDKINKSYQLDTTMKINEIAPRRLDEVTLPPWMAKGIQPVVKYVEPYLNKTVQAASSAMKPRIVMKPGETMDQAIARIKATAPASAEVGGIKAADPLVSNAELQALGAMPPERSGLSSVFKRRGDQGFDATSRDADLFNRNLPNYLQDMPPARIGSPPKPKPKADTSAADQEVRKTQVMNPRLPNKGKPSAEADAFAAEKAAAERQAAAAERQEPGWSSDVEPPMSASAPASPTPAATGGRQVIPRRPGQGSGRRAAPQPAADTVTLPRDMADRLLDLATRDPAAAQEQAKQWGWWGKKGLTAAGVAALGAGALAALPTAINAVRPGTVPDEYNPVAYVTKGPKEVLAPRPLPPSERIPSVVEPETDRGRASSTAPNAPAPVSPAAKAKSADEIPDNDPRVQEIIRQLEKNGKVDESTAALNRMIYLSRL